VRFCIQMLIVFFSFHAVSGEIPNTVIELSQVTDKSSEKYMFLASYAAMDAKQSAISALEGGDSSFALKILTAALQVMPHHDELRNLRNKVLENVIKITKSLEEDVAKNCDVLIERYHFIKVVSPDSLLQLKNESCTPIKPVVKDNLHPLEKDVFKIPEPKVIKELELAYKTDLSHAVDFYIRKNTNFPYDESMQNAFSLLFSQYGEDFSITCKNFKTDPNVESDVSIDLHGDCEFSGVSPTVIESKSKYCALYKDLFIVPDAKEELICDQSPDVKFPISVPLLRTYRAAFINGAFSNGVPVYLIMKMNFRYKDKNKSLPLFVHLPPGSTSFEVVKSSGKRYMDSISANINLKSLNRNEIKDLQAVTFVIDYKTTFDFYKDNFKLATEQELQCEKTQNRNMKVCPEKGVLLSYIEQTWKTYVVEQEMKAALGN
jgi:hypothetical protein